MVTKFSGKFAIIMLKKHRKFCRCGLTHLDATPTFKNRPNTYAPPCRTNLSWRFHKNLWLSQNIWTLKYLSCKQGLKIWGYPRHDLPPPVWKKINWSAKNWGCNVFILRHLWMPLFIVPDGWLPRPPSSVITRSVANIFGIINLITFVTKEIWFCFLHFFRRNSFYVFGK